MLIRVPTRTVSTKSTSIPKTFILCYLEIIERDVHDLSLEEMFHEYYIDVCIAGSNYATTL